MTNAEVKPRAEADSVGADNLETLIGDFEKETTEPKVLDANKLLQGLKPVIDYVKDERAQKQANTVKEDIEGVMAKISEPEAVKNLPKRFVRGYLEAYAIENPKFKDAFDNRGRDPNGWEAAVTEVGKSLAEEVGKMPGNQAKNDIVAAKAAVSGSGTPTEQDGKLGAVELFGMSQQDFKAHRQRLLAEAKG
jgi:hypothetical protein